MITTKNLYDWIVLATGLDNGNVIRANQNGPRPAEPFATFQIVTIESADYSDVNGVASDYDIDYTDTRKYMVGVDVNVYGSNALSLMQALNQSNSNPNVQSLFAATGTVLHGTESIQDLTALEDTAWVERYQAEFRFGTYNQITTNQPDYVWDDYEINGTLDGDAVSIKP
jgi:hypothetical protein